jgi:hypothetical protein
MSFAAIASQASRSFDHLHVASRIIDGAQILHKAVEGATGLQNPIQSLLDTYRSSGSAVAQGTALRALDAAGGGRLNTDALVRGDAPNAQTAQATQKTGGKNPAVPVPPKYDATSLYGPHGPRLSDIRQGQMNDCALLGTLGALANERPSAIRDSISYNPSTQNFTVRLYDSSGAAELHTVTQADITANITRGGGSRRDEGVSNAAIWPDVMEVARAKQVDTNHADGLDQGYADIAAYPDEAMRVITGAVGTTTAFNQNSGETRAQALDRMGTELRTAIVSDRPVTAWIVSEPVVGGKNAKQDGLVDDHVYTMTRAFQGADGKWYVTLRNPWGENNNAAEGLTRDSAFITMSLDKLERLGGLQSFQVGE